MTYAQAFNKEVRQFKNSKNSEVLRGNRIVHLKHKTIFYLCGITIDTIYTIKIFETGFASNLTNYYYYYYYCYYYYKSFYFNSCCCIDTVLMDYIVFVFHATLRSQRGMRPIRIGLANREESFVYI